MLKSFRFKRRSWPSVREFAPHIADMEEGINVVKAEIKHDHVIIRHFAPRYLAMKMLERDPEAGEKEREIGPHLAGGAGQDDAGPGTTHRGLPLTGSTAAISGRTKVPF